MVNHVVIELLRKYFFEIMIAQKNKVNALFRQMKLKNTLFCQTKLENTLFCQTKLCKVSRHTLFCQTKRVKKITGATATVDSAVCRKLKIKQKESMSS